MSSQGALAPRAETKSQSERVGAIVIGGDFQGLGIARSLGRQGIPVCIIDDEWSIAPFSRYVTHSFRAENVRQDDTTIAAIMAAGKKYNLDGWLIFPTRDETVAAIAKNRDALGKTFRIATPAWSSVEWAWDKRKTYRKALELGLAIPRTWYPESHDDLKKIDAPFPLVVKPAIKDQFVLATKVKAWRADNATELAQRFEDALKVIPPGEAMVQDMIPGGSESLFGVCMFFKEGRAVGSMVTQYRRQHPPQFGRSCTLVESVDMPLLEEKAATFLRGINYYGLAELEFKHDSRDGEYKLLDVNARTWGYHALGGAAGVDFVRMLFDDQVGHLVTSARARSGITWIRLATDLPVGLLSVAKRQLAFGSYLKSTTRFDIESVYSADDPKPWLAETAALPYMFFKKGF